MIKNMKAIYFDLDGTLVDSKLDFHQMRKDLGFPKNVPILEHIETLTDANAIESANRIVVDHELKGARESELYNGVRELFLFLEENKIPTAILTRNCRAATQLTLEKFNLKVEHVITREDFPAKPSPSALLHLAEIHQVEPAYSAYIGDYDFDIQTARNAGMKAGLFINDKNQNLVDRADFHFSCFHKLLEEF